MTVSVLVPFTSGDEHRERAHVYVTNHYRTHHPGWELIEGTSPGAWAKGLAVADAVSRADGGVLVVADADSFTDPDTLTEAVRRVVQGESAWVTPHRKVYRLNEHHTALVLDGADHRPPRTARAPYTGVLGGGITVLARDTWNDVPIDPRFEGWGGEDIAWGWALTTLHGPAVRLNAGLFHLWHPGEVRGRKNRGCPASEALAGRYREALDKPDTMRALIEEARCRSTLR